MNISLSVNILIILPPPKICPTACANMSELLTLICWLTTSIVSVGICLFSLWSLCSNISEIQGCIDLSSCMDKVFCKIYLTSANTFSLHFISQISYQYNVCHFNANVNYWTFGTNSTTHINNKLSTVNLV